MSEYPRSQTRQQSEAGREAARVAVRIAFAAAFAESLDAMDIRSRADAEALRLRCADIFEPLLQSPALDEETLPLLVHLYGTCVAYLVKAGLDLAPVVRVTAAERLPSTLLAWQLYQDPARAIELVDRNDTGLAFFMPLVLDAERPK